MRNVLLFIVVFLLNNRLAGQYFEGKAPIEKVYGLRKRIHETIYVLDSFGHVSPKHNPIRIRLKFNKRGDLVGKKWAKKPWYKEIYKYEKNGKLRQVRHKYGNLLLKHRNRLTYLRELYKYNDDFSLRVYTKFDDNEIVQVDSDTYLHDGRIIETKSYHSWGLIGAPIEFRFRAIYFYDSLNLCSKIKMISGDSTVSYQTYEYDTVLNEIRCYYRYPNENHRRTRTIRYQDKDDHNNWIKEYDYWDDKPERLVVRRIEYR